MFDKSIAFAESVMNWKFKENLPFMLWSLLVICMLCITLVCIAAFSPFAMYVLAGGAGLGGGITSVNKWLKSRHLKSDSSE